MRLQKPLVKRELALLKASLDFDWRPNCVRVFAQIERRYFLISPAVASDLPAVLVKATDQQGFSTLAEDCQVRADHVAARVNSRFWVTQREAVAEHLFAATSYALIRPVRFVFFPF